ncbi:MAG: cytochrome c peroxidase [Candidatus Aminicenantales bacterium]
MQGITRGKIFIAFAASLALAAACSGQAARSDADLVRQAGDLFGALPEVMASLDNSVTPVKVALGKTLFYESRISVDGTVSCARCHPLSLYAVDGLPKSVGNRCQTNPRNAPTVLNAAAQIAAHWVGNRTSVEDQARQALIGGPSFGMASYEAAEARLRGIPGYEVLFQKAFPGKPEPITAANFALAVGAFERTLLTPAPFDAFLGGNGSALDDLQKAGLKDFIETGCANCHNGAYFGGRSYQKFGVIEPYWKRTLSPEVDRGRYLVTKSEADDYVFKVPVLRNVQMTSPYFHDGSVGRLSDAVWIMGKVQLGTDLAEAPVKGIVAFLHALTGKVAAEALEVPILPASDAAAADPRPEPGPAPTAGLSPNEDLLQEHALLSRVLLVYEEIVRRAENDDRPDPDILRGAARIIGRFVEQYHEKLEEEQVFPRFAKAGPLADLVSVLLEQHRAGRVLTGRILERADAVANKETGERQKLLDDIRAFIRMYRPHASREGSVLFPAFRGLLPAKEFLELGDKFEAKEHEVLGAEGFEGQVATVAELEKRLGIDDLARYTPKRVPSP